MALCRAVLCVVMLFSSAGLAAGVGAVSRLGHSPSLSPPVDSYLLPLACSAHSPHINPHVIETRSHLVYRLCGAVLAR
jgi:hypothetical protein